MIASVRSEPALAGRARRPVAGAPLAWIVALALLASGGLATAIVRASRSTAREEMGLIASSVEGAHAQLTRSGASTELALMGMPLPPAAQTYEIWMLDGDGRLRPLSDMFAVTRTGHASVELPEDLRDVRELIVTREPIGGSDAPAGPPLLEILNPGALAR